jgi:hypothetical protein
MAMGRLTGNPRSMKVIRAQVRIRSGSYSRLHLKMMVYKRKKEQWETRRREEAFHNRSAKQYK